MAVELEQLQGYGLGNVGDVNVDYGEGNIDLAMTDSQAISAFAGVVLFAVGLTCLTGFAAGYYAKRAFFCETSF